MIKRKSVTSTASVKSSRFALLRKPTRFFKLTRKRATRYGLLAGNIVVVLVAVFIVVKNSGGNAANYRALSTAEESAVSNPLDAISASEIAANVALMTRMPETEAVLSYSNLVWADLSSATNSDQSGTIMLPQVLSGDVKTKEDIVKYKVVEGDSLGSLAESFGVTSNSIRWSNDLSGSTLTVGKVLYIPPVNGIAYKVKSGDTTKKLADKYNVEEIDIIRFNDAEVKGLKAGEMIVIPGGEVRVSVASSVSSISYRPRFNRNISFLRRYTSYQGVSWYDRGWCTDWASYRAGQLGNRVGNWGNANRWDERARAEGYYVGPRPKVGAVLQTDYGWAGHVGVVEEVSADGRMIKFSDMNGLAGWGNAAITNDWVSAAGYDFIYR